MPSQAREVNGAASAVKKAKEQNQQICAQPRGQIPRVTATVTSDAFQAQGTDQLGFIQAVPNTRPILQVPVSQPVTSTSHEIVTGTNAVTIGGQSTASSIPGGCSEALNLNMTDGNALPTETPKMSDDIARNISQNMKLKIIGGRM